MNFRPERSLRIADLDAICFPPPEHTPILDFEKSDECEWENLKIFALTDEDYKLIGFSAWGCPWKNELIYLIRYGIKPEHRRLGFGFLLLTYTLYEIRKSYGGVIYADVRAQNRASRKLMRKTHWIELGESDTEYDAEVGVRVSHTVTDANTPTERIEY